VAARHPRPRAEKSCASARQQQVSAASRQPSLRSGFTVSSVLFPVNQLLPPSPRAAPWNLKPLELEVLRACRETYRLALARQNHTASSVRGEQPVVFGPSASTAFHPTSVTIAIRPSIKGWNKKGT
jgi:hypothetical protein